MKKFLVAIFSLSLFTVISSKSAFAAATLSLSPATATKAVNDTFAVDIVMDTGGEAVTGATAILTFDASKLQVTDDNSSITGVQVTNGSIFPQLVLPENQVDNSAGTIRYDGAVTSQASAYTGHGTIATIHFTAKATGVTQVTFTYVSGGTTNTSLVTVVNSSGPANILNSVNNGTYTINATGGTTTTPVTGALENTIMLLVGGLFLITTGAFLAKKV